MKNLFRRFTGFLASDAKSVIAIDFMENFIRMNEANNSKYSNITFLQADVTKFEQPGERFEFVKLYLVFNFPVLSL